MEREPTDAVDRPSPRALLGHAGSRRRSVIVALAIAAVLLFVLAGFADELWDDVVENASSITLDQPVLDWTVDHRVPALTTAVSIFSQSGGPVWMPVIVGGAALALSLRLRDWTPLVLAAVAAAGSLLMTIVGKGAVGRARPPLADAIPPYETSFSFPSGHSLNSIVLAGIIGYIVLLRLRTIAARTAWIAFVVVYTIAMGLSRVYLGHHWLSDVLMAWVLGLGWLTVIICAHRLWRTARRDRRRPAPAAADASAESEHRAADGPTPRGH